MKSYLPARVCLVVLLALADAASADVGRDPQLGALIEAGRYAEADRAATARIAVRPDDMAAYLALIDAVTSLEDDSRSEAALKQLAACVARQPDAAVCHYGIGVIMGVQAASQGLMKALGSLGRIKEALTRAVELDPTLYAARSGLVQFYVAVPGVAGGSMSKARELANTAVARQPEHAKVLLAMIAVADKNYEQAERGLASVRAGDDRELQTDVADLRAQIGLIYLNDKQDAKARTLLERAVQDRPQSAMAQFGLGRALTDAGSIDAAIAALERAATLEGGTKLPIDYRLGVAWQSKGDRDRARAALKKFVATGKGSSKNLDDARKRLAELG